MVKTLLNLFIFSFTSAFAADQNCPGESSGTDKLWSRWYSVSTNDYPYAYYHEQASRNVNGTLEVSTRIWKKNKGSQSRVEIQTLARNDKFLTPLRYLSYHQSDHSSSRYEGRVSGTQLKVHGERTFRQQLKGRTFFGTTFPLWLKLRIPHLKKLPPRKFLTFQSIPENAKDSGFAPVPGKVKRMRSDAYAKSTQTDRFLVQLGQSLSQWWVGKDGSACQILIPDSRTLIQAVTQQDALSFLD